MPALDNSGYLIYLAGVAGLLHACLQLPLATLLHMAAHTLGRSQPGRALALSLSMALGVFLTVVGLLIIAVLIALSIPNPEVRLLVAGLATGLAGVAIMLGYFRGTNGAQLWLPRKYVRWFHKYIERRHSIPSAFSLGNLSVLLEAGFSFPLILSAGVLLSTASAHTALRGFGLYALLVTIPLVLVGISLTGGNAALRLQRWRAEGKRFWQFFVGLAFILFGLYVASAQFMHSGTAL